jgi:actin-related protein
MIVFSDCAESLLVNDKKDPSTGIVNQVLESLSLCDESIKRDLMQNVVLSGGTSLLPGEKHCILLYSALHVTA